MQGGVLLEARGAWWVSVMAKLMSDPFGEDELESGRLPKIIDDWLIAQIHAGKDTEAIRKVLSMSEEEKEEVSLSDDDADGSTSGKTLPPSPWTCRPLSHSTSK